MRKLLAILSALLIAGPANANFDVTTGSGTHIFAIDSGNQGTSLCAAASTECPASVPVNTAGTPLFTSGNAGYVQFPSAQAVSGTVTANLGTIGTAATAANQSTELGIIGNSNAGTVAHTCSVAGYSILSCAGQMDDDIKATGTIQGNVNVGPTDCSGTITTGGTAQNAITAQTTLHGFTIANIDATSGSGEDIWFSFTTTAAATTAGSYALVPVGGTIAGPYTWTAPIGFGTNHAVSIIAATTGHKFSCTWW